MKDLRICHRSHQRHDTADVRLARPAGTPAPTFRIASSLQRWQTNHRLLICLVGSRVNRISSWRKHSLSRPCNATMSVSDSAMNSSHGWGQLRQGIVFDGCPAGACARLVITAGDVGRNAATLVSDHYTGASAHLVVIATTQCR